MKKKNVSYEKKPLIAVNNRGEIMPNLDDYLELPKYERILINLKLREIAEQIRSNKVIEGVLQDIYGAIQSIDRR